MGSDRPAKIYLVERDPAVRDSLIWLLEALGFCVQAFISINEFTDAFGGEPGCLVVDVGFQGGEGARVAAALHAHRGSLPVIAISADPTMSFEHAARSGAQRFLPKPFTSEDLLRCIEDLLLRQSGSSTS